MFKRNKTEDSSGALKKKAMLCSTEAAAISIGIHVVLILLAGTWVAIEYVQKRGGDFQGENIARPKLERRQLQMPVKVQNLQKKSSRPKVTSRMASVSQSSFSLPDMMGLGDIGGGFDRSGGGDRTLSSMGAASSLGFGISGINFFGAKSKGEKFVFILDTDKDMVEDKRGGFYTYEYAKRRLGELIDSMRSATLFNVMVCNDHQTAMFRSKLVPATPENREALKAWLAPVNSSVSSVGQIGNMIQQYNSTVQYEDSVIVDEAATWLRAVQAAMEQRADNIFVLCPGWGDHPISTEHQKTMFGVDFSDKEAWLTSRGWPPERVAALYKKRAEDRARAEKIVAEENKERAKRGKPAKVVANWWGFMYGANEPGGLKWDPGESPPTQTGAAGGRWRYEGDEVVEHLEAVYKYNYIPHKLKEPTINIVKLIASDGSTMEEGDSNASEKLNWLKGVAQAFDGNLEFLRGAKTMEDLNKYNDLGD
jgi:hypothetical protein